MKSGLPPIAAREGGLALSYRFGDFALDTDSYSLLRRGRPVAVEPRVLEVLAYLLLHRGRVVPREELVARVWRGTCVSDDAVKRTIREARRALGDDARQPRFIATVHGRGYRFLAEVDGAGADPPAAPIAPAPAPDPRRPPSAEARALYLRGRWHWNQVTSEGCRLAAHYFERALAVEPDYALPHAWLAVVHTYRAIYGWAEPRAARELAFRHAQAAAALDAAAPEVHCALGLAHLYFDRDWQRTEAEYKEALRLAPHDATIRAWYALFLAASERTVEAEDQIARAVELDPLGLEVNRFHATVLLVLRRFAASLAVVERTIELYPSSTRLRFEQGQALYHLGRFEEAAAAYESGLALTADDPLCEAGAGWAWAAAGQHERALAALDRLLERRRLGWVPPFLIGSVGLVLGRFEEALAWFERGLEEGDVLLVHLRTHPGFEALHGEPRFAALLDALGPR